MPEARLTVLRTKRRSRKGKKKRYSVWVCNMKRSKKDVNARKPSVSRSTASATKVGFTAQSSVGVRAATINLKLLEILRCPTIKLSSQYCPTFEGSVLLNLCYGS